MIGGEVVFFSKANKIIEQLELHSSLVLKCFETYQMCLEQIQETSQHDTHKALSAMVEGISQLENQADQVRHEVIRYLLNGGFLVDNRKSTMRLIEGLDYVADLAEDIVQMMVYEQIQLPKWLIQYIIEINTITHQQLNIYIDLMHKIVSDYNLEDVLSDLEHIEKLESQVDAIENAVIRQIFELSSVELAYKNQLKALINLVAKVSDNIEDLSDEVEIILAARRI